MGKTGILTPVAKLTSVELAGVTIRNVSLHNEDEIRRKDVRAGDTVLIERAGDVIPYVVQVVLSTRPPDTAPFRFPETCPVCGQACKRSTAAALADGGELVYVGDGYSDRCAAEASDPPLPRNPLPDLSSARLGGTR